MRRPEVCPLTQVRLAKYDCAGLTQSLSDECIARWNGPLERVRTGGRRHAIRGVDVVLDEDRNPVQRPAHFAGLAFVVESIRDRKGIGISLYHVTQRRSLSIELGDP